VRWRIQRSLCVLLCDQPCSNCRLSPFACLSSSLKMLLERCCRSVVAISAGEDSTKGIQNFRTLATMPFKPRQGFFFTRHRTERAPDQYASSNHSAFPSSPAKRDGESSQAGSVALAVPVTRSSACRTGLSHFNTFSSCPASSFQKQKRQKRRQSAKRRKRQLKCRRRTQDYSSIMQKTR
jgi:hypothetical protein